MEQTVDVAEHPWQEFYKKFYQGKSKKCLTPDDFSEEEKILAVKLRQAAENARPNPVESKVLPPLI